ncbi:hypothetical protein J132_02944 [Termitomyces sp. J132]|nr:hypothetical protein H2248_012197 [Termitomyces sp. 'cryptogamus']KNZ72517.1 hypothetical protein J132_02944 [Termitomyces sp. J132]
MVHYRIPNLLTHVHAYIKPDMNPNYSILQAEYEAWIDQSNFFRTDAQKKTWKEADLALLSCRFFPKSSLEHLRICMDYVMISFILEQLTDQPATTAEAHKWVDVYKQAFKQTLRATEEPALIIKEFVDRLLYAVKDPHFVQNNIFLADSMLKEAADRATHAELDLEAYMRTRRGTIGMIQVFYIGRLICISDLSPEVQMHPDIIKLDGLSRDLVLLGNDLYSYKREYLECGAYHNYITIALRVPIAGLHTNDRQGAIDYTCQKFCETLADFEHTKKALSSFGENEDAKVAKYVAVLMDIIIGNIQWSILCGRYGHTGNSKTIEAQNWGVEVVFDL